MVPSQNKHNQKVILRFLIFIGLLLSVMYMTNAWDGIIYFLLALGTVIALQKAFPLTNAFLSTPIFGKYIESLSLKKTHQLIHRLLLIGGNMLLIGVSFLFFSLPFSIAFKPFVSGIGVLCAPKFLTSIGNLGPFLFEADHCQHSPFWQLIILHGFFYFFVLVYLFIIWKYKKLSRTDIFVSLLIFLSTLLIIIPEFIYAKDIYPGHYRANTMFKLVFQSYMMFSLCVGFILFRLFLFFREKTFSLISMALVIISLFLISIVFIYPFQAINSYYAELKTYYGLDGTTYLSTLYPDDYKAIVWMQKNIKGQPVIVEAQGDSYNGSSSYTDYARVSANTGLPTILGWTVHEWLWRGSYDIPAPRVEEIRLIYESDNLEEKRELLNKYDAQYIFLGSLEREKYPFLKEEDFNSLGNVVYKNGQTKIYHVTNK